MFLLCWLFSPHMVSTCVGSTKGAWNRRIKSCFTQDQKRWVCICHILVGYLWIASGCPSLLLPLNYKFFPYKATGKSQARWPRMRNCSVLLNFNLYLLLFCVHGVSVGTQPWQSWRGQRTTCRSLFGFPLPWVSGIKLGSLALCSKDLKSGA